MCFFCTLISNQTICWFFYRNFTETTLLDACSGGGWARPFIFGPAFEANAAISGHPGRRQYYLICARGNLLPLLCCEGKGYRNRRKYWEVIGCRNDGHVSRSVHWCNVSSKQAVRCKGSPNSILYYFSCWWKPSCVCYFHTERSKEQPQKVSSFPSPPIFKFNV